MKFTTRQEGAVTVITLEGNLMGGPDASALVDTLNACIDAKKYKVILDLAGVQFINSSGLGLMINGVTTMKNAGGRLTIANASQKILDMFKITRLQGIMETYPSTAEALQSYAA